MGHRSKLHPATAGRQFVDTRFGFNPVSNARILVGDALDGVAFTLTDTEITRVTTHLACQWLAPTDLDKNELMAPLLQHIARRL